MYTGEYIPSKILAHPAQVAAVKRMLESKGAHRSVGSVEASDNVKHGEIVVYDSRKKCYMHFPFRG